MCVQRTMWVVCIRSRQDATHSIFDSLSIPDKDEEVPQEWLEHPSLLAGPINRVEEFLGRYDSDVTSLQQLFLQSIPGIVTILDAPFVGLISGIEGSPCILTLRLPIPRIQIVVALCASSLCPCVLSSWLTGMRMCEEQWLSRVCLSAFSCVPNGGITTRG